MEQARKVPTEVLMRELGPAQGKLLDCEMWAVDDTLVTRKGPPQSLSEEDSLRQCDTRAAAVDKAVELLTTVCRRVMEVFQRHGIFPNTLRIAVRHYQEVAPLCCLFCL